MQTEDYSSHARDAYDALAPVYDEVNAQNDYEVWLGEILLPELEKHGLRKGWVLDVGCGTGRAFPPLLHRGWDVVGCDASKAMLDLARSKFPGLHLEQADARHLPFFISAPALFDLILALNDVVNYLTEDGDLEKCFEGMKRNLAPGGLVCFDANCLSVYEQDWLAGSGEGMSERGWNWRGLTDEAAPGKVFEAEVGAAGAEPHIHRQRHWPRREVETAMASAGLRCLGVLGQHGEGAELVLDESPDEALHTKLIYIGGHHG